MAVRAKSKRFIIRADQAKISCDVSGWDPLGVSVSNPTVQWLFLPSINDWVAPQSRGTFALGGDPAFPVEWGAPPGNIQSAAITSPVPQQASIVLTDQPLPNAGGPIVITANVAVTWQDGTIALPGFANQNDLTLGLSRPGANRFGFSVAGIEQLEIGNGVVIIFGILEPDTDGTRDLATSALRFRDLFLSSSVRIGTNPATTGAIRLANTANISARNVANGADIPLIALNASDKVVIANQAPGADGTVLTADAATTGGLKYAAVTPILTTSTVQLGGDVTMTNANQYYDGPSVTLAAGTWLVIAVLTIRANGAARNTFKLWDGTTVFASGAEATDINVDEITCTLTWIITSPGATTYKISAASTLAGGTIKAASANNGAGNTASSIVAVKMG